MGIEGLAEFREFIVFAKHLNVTRAAEELHVSTSTLSRHLAALEREIGMPLIRREGASAALTPVGSLVLKKASTLVGEYDSLLEQVEHYRADASYVLRVAYALDDRTIIDALSLAKLRLKQTYGGFNVQPFHGRGQSAATPFRPARWTSASTTTSTRGRLPTTASSPCPSWPTASCSRFPRGPSPTRGRCT